MESLAEVFCIFGDFVFLLLLTDVACLSDVLLILADDLNSFSCPSVNAESNFLLTDSAIDDTFSNIADCH